MNANSDLPRQNFWRDLSLLLASTMTIMAGATLAPALPGMRDAFAANENIEFWVKFLLAVPGLCIAISAPAIGRQLIHVGARRVLLAGLFVCGASGSVGYFFHDSLFFLLGTRIILGLSVAAIMVSCMTLAASYYQGPTLASYMGLQAAFGGFGGVIFMAGAGLLADVHWSHPFLIYFLAFALLPIASVFIYPRDAEHHLAPSIRTEADTPKNNPNLSMVMFSSFAFIEMLLLYAVPLNFPFFIEHFTTPAPTGAPTPAGVPTLSGESPTVTGIVMALWLLLAAVISRYYGKLNRNRPFQQLQAYGLVIIGIGFSGLYFSSNLWFTTASLLFSAIGFGIVRPNLMVWLFSLTPAAERGLRVGQLTRWYFIGQISCAVIAEPLVSLFGYAGSYCFFAGIALVTGLLLLGVSHKWAQPSAINS